MAKSATIGKSSIEVGSKLAAVDGQFVGTCGVCQFKCEGGDLTLQFGPSSFVKQRLINAKKSGYMHRKSGDAVEYTDVIEGMMIRYEFYEHRAKDVITVFTPAALNNLQWILETSDDIGVLVADGKIVIDSKAFNITDDPDYPTRPYCRLAELEEPVVVDADGNSLKFSYELSGNVLRLVPDQSLKEVKFPLTVDPAYLITSLSKAFESTCLIWDAKLKRLFAIWLRDVSGDRHCYISYSDNGGINWTTLGAVSGGITLNGGLTYANAILDSNGIMHIFFGAYPQGSVIAQLYHRRFNPQTMQFIDAWAVKLTNEFNHNGWNNVDIDDSGLIHVAVTGRYATGACYTARYLSFNPDSYTPPLVLTSIGPQYADSGATAGFHSYGTTVVAASNGDLHCAWHTKDAGTSGTFQIYYRRRVNGSWGPITALTCFADYPHTAALARLYEDIKTHDIMLLMHLQPLGCYSHALMNITKGTTEFVHDSQYSQVNPGILYQYPSGNLALLYSGYSQEYPTVAHLRLMHRIDGVWKPDQEMYYTPSGPIQLTNHPFDRTRYANAKMRALAGVMCNFRFPTGSSNCFKTDNFALAAKLSAMEW